MYKKGYILVVFLLSLSSCNYLNFKNQDNTADHIVASVGDRQLLKKDVEAYFSTLKEKRDSAKLRNEFIENWAKKQILLQKANLNLSPQNINELQKMIEEYRVDLYINSYKNELVSQNLDTLVSKASIEQYYKENRHIFKLRNVIIKFRYLAFVSKSFDENKLKKQFVTLSSEALDSLVQVNELKFTNTFTNDSVWINYKDFIKIDPIFYTININKILSKKNNFIVLKDSVHTHFLYIKDNKRIGEIAPLDQVTPVINQMILHKKKLEYFKELDNSLIQEAIKNKTFKTY